jgi:serine protease Do
MIFSKYRIAIPAAILACLLAACSAAAQNNRVVIQSNSGDTFLGISMEDVTASNMSEYKLTDERGVIVRSVQEGSPAEEATLRENDVILEFAGQPVWSSRQFSRLVTETPAGRNVKLTVSRDGKLVNLSATLQARSDRGLAGNNAEQRLREAFPGGQMERFFESLPPGIQLYPPDSARPSRPDTPGDQPRSPRNAVPQRPEVPGGRQGVERADQRPRLGVELQSLTEQMADYLGVPDKKGALIASVLSGSVSEGNLRAGDVVVGVNDREITSPEELTRFIRDASGEITVRVIRDKKQISVRISLPSEETPQRGGYRL